MPGIGKSRLIAELFQVVDRDPELILWRQGRSLPYGEGLSYWAVAEIVKSPALGRRRSAQLLAALLDQVLLPVEIQTAVLKRTEGNSLSTRSSSRKRRCSGRSSGPVRWPP